jgi:glycosyltransferase involved in cell wall biosynthesis
MSEPSVTCICLTADRQRFTDRAVGCFLRQTYRRSDLVIYDTGVVAYDLSEELAEAGRMRRMSITVMRNETSRGHAIGALRNEAIDMTKSDLIAHWDSDDWYAPERIERQVEAATFGPTVIGFHNALFFDTRTTSPPEGWTKYLPPGVAFDRRFDRRHAWEYDCTRSGLGKVIGSSLMYHRDAWVTRPFNEHLHTGEDNDFEKRFHVQRLQGIVPEPLMIAEVHGANTSGVYGVFDNHSPAFQPEWRRAPEWDAFCRETLYP